MTDDRRRLGETFDRAASTYHQARPDYPDALFATLVRETGITGSSRLLEIGCGTGKATLPLARRGFSITAVEPGPALAAEAASRLGPGDRVRVVQARFEDWASSADEHYDLVYAATSWHWLDPATRYALAARLIPPGGSLAFWSAAHVFPDDGDPFFAEIQEVYDAIGHGQPPGEGRPRPGHLPDQRDELTSSGHYEDVRVVQFDWEVTYDATSYLALLDTFSGHLAMRDEHRDHLYGEIRARLEARPEPVLRRHWGAALHVARRRDTGLTPGGTSGGGVTRTAP